jgi:uncharacterized membrane protein YeaQ/YmgE (transglycosylase-associated protein family)
VCVVGLLLAGLILSPLGRASGGHLNPAISLAMSRLGVFPGRTVLLYWAAQLTGSLVGVLVAAVLAGQFGFLTAYLLAPLAGAVVAAWLLGRFRRRKVLTPRLCGHPTDAAHDVPP